MNSWGSELASAFVLRCLTGARRRGRLDSSERSCRKRHSCLISAAVGRSLIPENFGLQSSTGWHLRAFQPLDFFIVQGYEVLIVGVAKMGVEPIKGRGGVLN